MNLFAVVTQGRTSALTSLIAGACGLVVAIWLAGPSHARNDAPPEPTRPTLRGRVLDDAGQPIAGARVRLYRRDSRWERRNPVVAEATSEPDGAFRLSEPLAPRPLSESRGLPAYVLLADCAGRAVGWTIIPLNATTFEGDITLRSASGQTITVVDSDGRPVQGAKVVAYILGGSRSPLPDLRSSLELRPDDGPLTAVTSADGRATLHLLPKTTAYFVATKPGFAETYTTREQGTIRLTPGATLSGRLTGPGGMPLSGVKVVLHTVFMWDFEHTVTDAGGRYRFNDLRARGWDMSLFTPNKEADGNYKIWIDDDRFVIPTQSATLEPGANRTLDFEAMKAGVIRVTLVEEGANKPVSGARIWGFDAETGSSARFNAYTDEQGRATFYSAPSRISLSLVGPPDGVYLKGNGRSRDTFTMIEFPGGEAEVKFVMPPIAGTLVTVSGVCTLRDGSPARDVRVHAGTGFLATAEGTYSIRSSPADGEGRFFLEGIPAGQLINLYAESADRKFAGTADFTSPAKSAPTFRTMLMLAPTVAMEKVLLDDNGKPLNSRTLHVSPYIGEQEFDVVRRTQESDAQGRVRFDGIVPGLSYRIQEEVPKRDRRIVLPPGARLLRFDEVLVLALEKSE